MAKKKYDPLWEIVHEKVALQGQGSCDDAVCPHCNVRVHVPEDSSAGQRVSCGLCGKVSQVVLQPQGKALAVLENADQ